MCETVADDFCIIILFSLKPEHVISFMVSHGIEYS